MDADRLMFLASAAKAAHDAKVSADEAYRLADETRDLASNRQAEAHAASLRANDELNNYVRGIQAPVAPKMCVAPPMAPAIPKAPWPK